MMPQAEGLCIQPPILGQYIVNASATGGPTEVDRKTIILRHKLQSIRLFPAPM